jgi:hypothetical protein
VSLFTVKGWPLIGHLVKMCNLKHQLRPAGAQTPGSRRAYHYDPITTRDTILIFRVWHGKFLTFIIKYIVPLLEKFFNFNNLLRNEQFSMFCFFVHCRFVMSLFIIIFTILIRFQTKDRAGFLPSASDPSGSPGSLAPSGPPARPAPGPSGPMARQAPRQVICPPSSPPVRPPGVRVAIGKKR